jgi:hypothetical protein
MSRVSLSSEFQDGNRAAGRASGPLVRIVLGGLAALLLGSMFAAAVHDASQAWDVGYYHLPFAGRLGGLLPETSYVFSRANEARYRGFGLLAELLQGLLWRVTGRPESANLVAFASVPLLAWFARRWLGVPWYLTVLSLLAIPLVHTHATSAYVDLPASAAASVVVLLTLEAYAASRPVPGRAVAIAMVAAAVAANIKPMLQPTVAVSLVLLGVRLVSTHEPKAARRWLALAALGLPLVFATPLKNLVLHHNPYFPLRLTLFGALLPGTEDPYSSSPVWLEHAPRTLRFFASLLEVGARPFSDPRRWTVDQWMPPDAPGYRMGGFFNAYVVVHLVALAWRAVSERTRRVRVAAIGFALLTALVSLMPQSHELRYYMVWMLVLVLTNLCLACGTEKPSAGVTPAWLGGLAALALGVVLVVTRGVYAYPSGSSFDDLVRAKVEERTIDGISKDERVCVNKEPFDVLWAPVFHPERRYVLKEAESPEDCDGIRPLE